MTQDLFFSETEMDEMYQKWHDTQTFEAVDKDEIRKTVVDDLNKINQMSVEEYTLYQKWEEIQFKYPTVNDLFGGHSLKNKRQINAINRAKSLIWIPKSLDDYMGLEPELVYVKEGDTSVPTSDNPDQIPLSTDWTTLRIFCSNQMHAGVGPQRAMSFLIRDKVSRKYLGVITVSGDFLDLTARDEKIGWTREQRTDEKRVRFTAIGSTIIPMQPLGFNYVGGKLLSLLCLSEPVPKLWEKSYGDKLVGVTTTSLYGKYKGGHGMSQYDNLKYWKRMGYSKGSIAYQPSKKVKKVMRNWLRVENPRKYWEYTLATRRSGLPFKRDATNRCNQTCYRGLDIKSDRFQSSHERGIYFAKLYTNTNEFLRADISEDKLEPAFDNSVATLVDLWKNKYARRRIESLQRNDRVSDETFFLDDLVTKTWPETKEKYLGEVGR